MQTAYQNGKNRKNNLKIVDNSEILWKTDYFRDFSSEWVAWGRFYAIIHA